MTVKLMQGDCIERMSELGDNSVDSVVTDPPYGLGFMGKKWDVGVPAVDVFAECLRVLKPGGHLLAFGGSRTYHRLAVAVEDAGFEIRDQIQWVYGSGFPKSLDVSKAIDKAAGAEREVVGSKAGLPGYSLSANKGANVYGVGFGANGDAEAECAITAPATDAAQQWDGWGTALKPAHEPIVMARKPLAVTVAANVMQHGTGALNVDGCRVPGSKPDTTRGAGGQNGRYGPIQAQGRIEDDGQGRFPANLIHDGSDEATEGMGDCQRYFYCAKASKKDRGSFNDHPTVKPIDLMRYLCRLVTPPGGVVLDPFAGSGSTGKAAVLEGFDFIGIELDPDYFAIAENRIADAKRAVS